MPDWLITILVSVAGVLLASFTAAIRHLWNRQKKQRQRERITEEGLQALLYDRIYQGYEYCRNKGYASVDDIKNLEYLYRPYHALGGNDTGTELFERIKKMPAEPSRNVTI